MLRGKIRCYYDMPILHPELTEEERKKKDEELKEEMENMTEWPEIY